MTEKIVYIKNRFDRIVKVTEQQAKKMTRKFEGEIVTKQDNKKETKKEEVKEIK